VVAALVEAPKFLAERCRIRPHLVDQGQGVDVVTVGRKKAAFLQSFKGRSKGTQLAASLFIGTEPFLDVLKHVALQFLLGGIVRCPGILLPAVSTPEANGRA